MISSRGQIGIVSIVGVIIALLFLAPILLNIVKTTTSEFSDALNSTDTNAAATVTGIKDTYVNLWDWVLILVFALNVLLLFISAFFIDTHPAFILVFIMVAFFTMAFAPNILDAVDQLWGDAHYAGETGTQLAFMNFLRENFGGVLLSIFVLAGIIMYAKFKYFSTPS